MMPRREALAAGMRLAVIAAAAALLLSATAAQPAEAQEAAMPPLSQLLIAQTQAPMTEAQIDSACAARALPLPAAGAALFGGLVESLRRARAPEPMLLLAPGVATARAVTIVAGWYAVLLVMGVAMLIFAGDRVRQVTEILEADTVGALVTGVLAALLSVPVLLLVTVGLALTILGVLLIPFALVILLLIYAGLIMLGLLAVANVAGRAMLGRRKERMTDRAASLAGIFIGLTLLIAAWFVAALFTWSPSAGLVLRSMALGLTVVAVTAGAGAVIRSFRRGERREEPPVLPRPEDVSWQTPTPIGGVVAVRRSGT